MKDHGHALPRDALLRDVGEVQWNVAGAVGIADVLTVMFLVAFALEWGRPRFPRTTVTVLAIFAALLVIYLIGFFNIETKQSLDQWGKGMVKFVLHFLFLGAGVAYLSRRSTLFYWKAVGALTVGLVVNASTASCSCSRRAPGRTSTMSCSRR